MALIVETANASWLPTTTVLLFGSIFKTYHGSPVGSGTVSAKPRRWPIV